MRVIFLGNSADYSPYFVETLGRCARDPSSGISLLSVVCPVRFASRGQTLWFSVKRGVGGLLARIPPNVTGHLGLPAPGAWHGIERAALSAGARMLWPSSMNDEKLSREIAAMKADVAIVAGLDRILSEPVLRAFPPLYNIHPSLLPEFRGATPEFWQLDSGVSEGGVTLHRIDAGVDTGPIVLQRRFAIEPWLDSEALLSRSARVGVELMREFLRGYPKIAENPILQRGGTSQRAAAPQDYDVLFTRSAGDVFNRARAASYRRPLVTYVARDAWKQQGSEGRLEATIAPNADAMALHLYEPVVFPGTTQGMPGELRKLDDGSVALTCNPGTVVFRRVEPRAGRRGSQR